MTNNFQQGEIWYADLNPVRGNEQSGYRPVVIVSGNMLNTYLNLVIVMPLTSRIKNYKGNLVLAPDPGNGLEKESEVLMFHIRSIAKERLVKRTGRISDRELGELKRGFDDIWRY
ncbi:type II toxin-antitoxin system PemK/MazF family toxin [Sinomicrobium soli]|uniref:type II toxin-antitoxin system PemK/MazF family toxin n=1 Tax=Sinomicrobium sp. N-1-3-6 TaxID=2219864 RepID=UPI000DCB7A24|nr:type II toxin-antitoxin system PemK/MazF family toxin [Sinomicrobium sp. N-1-3-6]RAV27849.1 type II toxin-antitoxin system PemK/MazF family toxin [Sinomicrobium sp. N-1-3-6]